MIWNWSLAHLAHSTPAQQEVSGKPSGRSRNLGNFLHSCLWLIMLGAVGRAASLLAGKTAEKVGQETVKVAACYNQQSE